MSEPNYPHIYALIETEVAVQVRRALHRERHHLATTLRSVAAQFGGPVQEAVSEIAKAWEP